MWQTIKDWCWWTFVIRRDEFHPRLDTVFRDAVIRKKPLEVAIKKQERRRSRAHRLDMRWGGKRYE
jgi:heme oxygenase